MSSTVFSTLSKGYGSWTVGDLEAKDNGTLPKPILPINLEREDSSFKDKSLNIPLRTKTPQTTVNELLKTKNVIAPPEDTYTVYSRPKTATSTKTIQHVYSPRTPRIQSCRMRAKSAPPYSPRYEQPVKPDGELVLPKTFLTRRGAMLLFTAPEDLVFSQEQKCYSSHQHKSADVFDLGLRLKTVNKLTASVLQYGQDSGPENDFESYSTHYDKTFTKFLRDVDDETAMDIHAQPGGDYSFYLRDLQVRTQSGMGFRPSSGRSVTSDLERAELQEELRKMDAGDAGSHGYRISADVSQLTESYSQPSPRQSMQSDRKRKPSSAKSVLSAMKLAASLKSTNYLGRPGGAQYLPMTISPWRKEDNHSDMVDVPLPSSIPPTRPQTADDISSSSRRSPASMGSAGRQRSEVGEDDNQSGPVRDESLTGYDKNAIGQECYTVTEVDKSLHSESKGDEQIADINDKDGGYGGIGVTGQMWSIPSGESEVKGQEDDKCSRPVSVSMVSQREEEDDLWIGGQVDEEQLHKAMSEEDLMINDNDRKTTTPVSDRTHSATRMSSRKPSVAGSERVPSRTSKTGRESRVTSATAQSIGDDRPGSMAAQSIGDDRPGSMAAQSIGDDRPGSMAAQSIGDDRPGSVAAQSIGDDRPGSMAAQSIGDDRPGSTAAQSIGDDRPGSMAAQSIGDDRPGSMVAQSIGDDRPGSVAAHSVGISKVDSGIGHLKSRSITDSRPGSARSEIKTEDLGETMIATHPLQAPYQGVIIPGSEAIPVEDTTEPTVDGAIEDEGSAWPATGELMKAAQEPEVVSGGQRIKNTDEVSLTSSQKTTTLKAGIPENVMVIPQEKSSTIHKQPEKSTNQKVPTPVTSANQKMPSPVTTNTDIGTKTKTSEELENKVKLSTPKKTSPSTPPTQKSTRIPTPPKPMTPKNEVKTPTPPATAPKKEKALDLSELKAMMATKTDNGEAKTKKSVGPKKEKKKKGGKLQFVDSLGIENYGPSADEIEAMVQQELAKELNSRNLSETINQGEDMKVRAKENKKSGKSLSVASAPDSGIDTAITEPHNEIVTEPTGKNITMVTSDDEDAAIEAELKAKYGNRPKSKKSKKQMIKEKAALKEAKKEERLRREAELKELEDKRKEKEEAKRREKEEQRRKKQLAEEAAQDAAERAQDAQEAEEEARLMLVAARKKAKEERESKRKAELERRRQEREQQREERRRMEEEASKREQEMLERLASAEERRKMRELQQEKEWEREEELRLEEEERQRQEDEERKRMEAEEEKIRELERQAEEEAMERLIRERLEAERLQRQAQEQAERERIEAEMRRQEEILLQQQAEERRLQRELEEQRRLEKEKQRLLEIQRLEMEARERVRLEIEKRRMVLMRRRDQNLEHRDHLQSVRQTQGLTRPWVFSYYVHWNRDTYEKPLSSNEDKKKKKGFRPKAKSKS
ncbi:uncharacterized protein LOC144452642 isoform X2 [Glandiceps talaboti]